tara:strand:- start:109095 stop:110441 length:1347 start_codon:yes stop_codon:yes gene_type:complete
MNANKITRSESDARTEIEDAGWMHDLRTIASTLLTYADVFAVSKCSREEFLDAMRANCTMLLTLADGISSERTVTSPHHHSVPGHSTDPTLNLVIASVTDAFRLGAVAKGFELKTRIDTKLPRIPHPKSVTVQRILSNLISNAIRHSCGSSIVIRADELKGKASVRSQASNTHCVIEVQDFGIGLTEAQISTLTANEVTEISSEGPVVSGFVTGGLATVRQLVASIGGTISVESQRFKGTCITIVFPAPSERKYSTIPFSPSSPNAAETNGFIPAGANASLKQDYPQPESGLIGSSDFRNDRRCNVGSNRGPKASNRRLSRRRILMIDDDAQLTELLSALLADDDVQMVAVQSESEAIKYFEHHFDLVLIDLSLGETDGCVVAERMRSSGYGGQILAFSAESPLYVSAPRQKRINTLFDGWVDKGVGGTEVATHLRRVLDGLAGSTKR